MYGADLPVQLKLFVRRIGHFVQAVLQRVLGISLKLLRITL
jgi:hypothetical protein